MLCVRTELGEEKLTVGKIYAGLLIAENWKAFKTAEKTANSKGMVRRFGSIYIHTYKLVCSLMMLRPKTDVILW